LAVVRVVDALAGGRVVQLPVGTGDVPLLVRPAGAGPQLQLSAVRGAIAGDVQALAVADHLAGSTGVGVLLVGPVLGRPAVAGPDLDLVPVRGAVARVVQALGVPVQLHRAGDRVVGGGQRAEHPDPEAGRRARGSVRGRHGDGRVRRGGRRPGDVPGGGIDRQ